eukprot:gene27877-34957_t
MPPIPMLTGGYAAVLREVQTGTDGSYRSSLMEFASNRIYRICHSTEGAELIVTGGATDASCWLKLLLTEIGLLTLTSQWRVQRDVVVSDARNVTTTLHTSKMPRERNLALDLARMRRLVEDGEAEFLHISTGLQIADALTKPKPNDQLLSRVAMENEIVVPGVQPTL